MNVSLMQQVQVLQFEAAQEKEKVSEAQQDRAGVDRAQAIDKQFQANLEAVDEGRKGLATKREARVVGALGGAAVGLLVGLAVGGPVGAVIGLGVGLVAGFIAGAAAGPVAAVKNEKHKAEAERSAKYAGMEVTVAAKHQEDAKEEIEDAQAEAGLVESLRQKIRQFEIEQSQRAKPQRS